MALACEPKRGLKTILLCVSLLAVIASGAFASEAGYPSRPVDFIVPWGSGGGADYMGRALAKALQPVLNTPLPVLNVPGGTGQTGLIKMRDSKADGYTIEEVTSETVLLEVTRKPLFNPADFVCVAIIDQQNPGLVVRADSPFRTLQDVIEAAKIRPVSVAFDGYGSSGDLLLHYVARKFGGRFTLVPYDKPGERIASVLGGHNELLFTQPGDVASYIAGQQLRPIVMFANRRDSRFPAVPISSDLGLDADLVHFRAVFMHAETPAGIVHEVTNALNQATASAGYVGALANEGALEHSDVSAGEASKFIESWLREARRLRDAK